MSECASTRAVNSNGCGEQPALQAFVDLAAGGTGRTSFIVTAYAANGPNVEAPLFACANQCVLDANAVSRSGQPAAAVQRLHFDPSVRRLVPPDTLFPAAGACGQAIGADAVIDTNPDIPQPRCLVVRADQHLEVRNTSNRFGQPGQPITLTWPPYSSRTLAAGASTVYGATFSSYLALGVHDVRISLYPGGGAEVWLRPSSS